MTTASTDAAAIQVLLLTDSLAFHGPGMGELTTEARLWPNVMADRLASSGQPCEVIIYGRRGWMARDAWFALTRDPYVYSVLLPRVQVIILAVGGMDYLPRHHAHSPSRRHPAAAAETARHCGDRGFPARAQPVGSQLLRGRWWRLPAGLTDHYLSRCVQGIRYFHPTTRVSGVVPPPHHAPGCGHVRAGHLPAVRAALKWGQREWVELLRFDQWVAPFIATGGMNVDGIHWGWDCHREVGQRSAAILANSGSPGPAIAAIDNGKRQRSSITSMQPDLLLTEPR